ncbi:MAG TPA: L,D-transpeptidase family protein [Chloroflexi bacterium]|nr:MAG: hypothetical protein B6243_08990 [Anaerolineaceae bacterium 4572_5.2]HEY86146.1 L,D-transpeptidase family protein [Chloroflexota bacterium]
MKRRSLIILIALLVLLAFTVQPALADGSYTVQAGDTLSSIAGAYGVSVSQLAAANGLGWNSWVYTGQQLAIPGGGGTASYYSGGYGEHWIDVNLSTQTLTAYEGQVPVYSTLVSTGMWGTPTVVGTFQIYVKHYSALMTGGYGASYYYLPDVPYVMYFYGGYGLHGAYWHNNFGAPMSHGCVNLSVGDAAWLFNWASVGTRVVTHY